MMFRPFEQRLWNSSGYLSTSDMDFHHIIFILCASIVRGDVCSSRQNNPKPHHLSCDKYIICLKGVPVERDCTEGYHFDVFSESCQLASIATCVHSTEFTDQGIRRKSLHPIPSTLPPICSLNTATTQMTTSVTTPQTTKSVTCSITQIGYLVHDKNCSFYYLCIFGILINRKCPHGYEFSPRKRMCLPKNIAGCVSTLRKSMITTPTVTTVTTPSTIRIRPVCDMTKTEYLPDFHDCRYYYICLFGSVVRKMCPNGQFFSVFTFNCLPEDQVICPVNTNTITDTTPSSITTQNIPYTTTAQATSYKIYIHSTPPTTSHATVASSSTSQVNTPIFPLPQCTDLTIWMADDSTDCAYYYACIYGDLKREKCNKGYYFDSHTLVCQPMDQVNCNLTVAPLIPSVTTPYTTTPIPPRYQTETKTPTHQTTTHPTFTESSPHPTTAHVPIELNDSQSSPHSTIISVHSHPTTSELNPPLTTAQATLRPIIVQVIPESTTYKATPLLISTESVSQPINTQSTPQTIVRTTTEPITLHTTSRTTTIFTSSLPFKPIPFPPQSLPRCTYKDIWIVSDSTDCKYFYACILGVVKHVKCEPGHYFDSVTLDCLPKDKIDCTLITSSSTATMTSEAMIVDHTTTLPPSLPLTATPSATTESTITLPQIPECAEFDIWMSADPLDCGNYYLCVLGYVQLHHCQKKYKFDSAMQECLPENEVNCTRLTITSQTSPSVMKSTTTDSATQTIFVPTQLPITTPIQRIKTTVKNIRGTTQAHNPSAVRITDTLSTTTTPSTISAAPLCKQSDVWFSPDRINCHFYYICLFGFLGHNECPNGHHFHPQLLKCLPKAVANCTIIKSVATPNITFSTNTSLRTTAPSNLNYYTTMCKPNASWLWPDTNNCSFYYLCLVGSLKYMKCEDGSHFSAIQLKCLPVSEAKCIVKPSIIDAASSTATNTTQQATMQIIKSNTTIYSSTQLRVTTPSAMPLIISANNTPSTTVLSNVDRSCNDLDVWIRADPDNCRMYYTCIHGALRHRQCPFVFYFDSNKRECLPKHIVKCHVPMKKPTTSEPKIIKLMSTTPSTITTPTPLPMLQQPHMLRKSSNE